MRAFFNIFDNCAETIVFKYLLRSPRASGAHLPKCKIRSGSLGCLVASSNTTVSETIAFKYLLRSPRAVVN